MGLFFRRIYFLWGVVVFVVCMFTFTPLILLSVTFIKNEKASGKVAYFWLKCWGYGFSTFCLVFYKVKGKENIDPNSTYIFVCNHNSFLDGIAICLAIPNDFRPLGKVEMLKIPVFGLMYRHVVILLDRESKESKLTSMIKMKECLKKGISILIFPEGTMNRSSDLLQPFKNGSFSLAIESGNAIVPMVMLNTKKCLPREPKFTFRPGLINIWFLPPVSANGINKNDLNSLKSEVYLQIEERIKSDIL